MTGQEKETEDQDVGNQTPGNGNTETAEQDAVADDNAGVDVNDAAAEEAAEAAPLDEKTPEEEIAELKDRLLRALAENENLIRRARREREDATKYAASNFARDMLGVADNLSRALDAAPPLEGEAEEAMKVFLEGVELTRKELSSALERHGIVRISPLGEKFDHDRHEALFEVPTAEADPGTVMQVVEDGYMIHDRLLRAARVGVAKAPDAAPGDQPHELDTKA